MHYSDDLIILDLAFIEGRSKETRLALLKHINTRIATAAQVSPDDLMILLHEGPGENYPFGQGSAAGQLGWRMGERGIPQGVFSFSLDGLAV
jgi:hypothetical protein